MNLDGSAVLHADRERVWSVITDPAVLARTIPGCVSLERVGDDEYRMNVNVGVGAIKGTYSGEVRLADQKRPASYVMHASGAGGPGQVKAVVPIELVDNGDGTTTLTYSADAVVGGPVAGVGQRMITGVAKRMAAQFFSAVDEELAGRTVVPIESAPSAATVGAEGTDPSPAPLVFPGGATPGTASSDVRSLVIAAAGGALMTLLGVIVGHVLGRRSSRTR